MPVESCDILIVGAGAAGLCAALRAHQKGLKPLVIEKSSKIGGATAYSGGGVWIPNNKISKAAGVSDSIPEALTYMNKLIGDVGAASSPERRMAFLTKGPEMVNFLSSMGFKWRCAATYPDYYPGLPGGKTGRTIEGDVFNLKKLGDWQDHLLAKPGPDLALHTDEYHNLPIFRRTWTSMGSFMRVISRTIGRKLIGQKPVTLGKSLVAQLMFLCKERGIPIWRESPLIKNRLLVKNNRVVGALVSHKGNAVEVQAKKGVLLCAGGFAKNLQMRETYGEKPASNNWTMVPPGDEGDAVETGSNLGAALALMDDAWWGPVFIDPSTDERWFALAERSLPHSIIVDSKGKRFMDESQCYTECGHDQYIRHKQVSAIPAWFIFDSQHRNKYMLWKFLPGKTPKSAFESGLITKADSIEELAKKLGVNTNGLQSTISQFNEMAISGIDTEFDRGNSEYDNYFGDPTCKPNPNLGSLERGPFFAMKVWPGDLGTKGGLLTDQDARVLTKSGKAIEGLYAAGNTTASVMGRAYPGAGATIGPALIFAFIAADHMAKEVVP